MPLNTLENMNREPSIHITKTDFEKICKDIFPQDGIVDYHYVVYEVFKRAKSKSISTRTITIASQQLEKKAKRLVQSSRNDADLFAQLIFAVRKKLKHRGISQIKAGSREWDMVKEITKHALDFCIANDLPKRAGFLKYIEIGLNKIKKYSLSKFPSLQEAINDTYLAMREIEMDDTPDETEEMYKTYSLRILEHTGIIDTSREMPEKYVWFVRAKKESSSINVSPSIYIEAQFDALDFVNGIPHPTQLVGEKAKDRVVRYLFKNNINVKKKPKKKDWLENFDIDTDEQN